MTVALPSYWNYLRKHAFIFHLTVLGANPLDPGLIGPEIWNEMAGKHHVVTITPAISKSIQTSGCPPAPTPFPAAHRSTACTTSLSSLPKPALPLSMPTFGGLEWMVIRSMEFTN